MLYCSFEKRSPVGVSLSKGYAHADTLKHILNTIFSMCVFVFRKRVTREVESVACFRNSVFKKEST